MRWGGGGGGEGKFASEIRVGAPYFAYKSIGDWYPKFYSLNFKCDPRICVLDLGESLWRVCYVSDI